MSTYTLIICMTLFVSAACGLIFIPATLKFCKSRNLYDQPSARKVHSKAVPRLGGISFFPSMAISFFIALAFIDTDGTLITINLWSVFFLVGVLLIFLMGIVDDIIGLSPLWKFAVQCIAACALPLSGLYIDNLHGLLGIYQIPYFVGLPLTIILVVFICNAINLIDGIDGLAACLSLLALTGFLIFFASQHVITYSILIAGLIGVLVAFLYFNLLGDPQKQRKIFMGDSGSLTLGFTLAFLCVKCSMTDIGNIVCDDRTFAMAYTLIMIPMLDAARVFFVRLYHGTSPFEADKTHIHHKLMRMGLNQHQTLATILCIAAGYILLNYLLIHILHITLTLVADIVIYILLNLLANQRIDNISKKTEANTP